MKEKQAGSKWGIVVKAIAREHGSLVRVYVALCSYADAVNGWCFPTVSTLANDCDMKQSHVSRALQELELKGWIERKRGLTPYGHMYNGWIAIKEPKDNEVVKNTSVRFVEKTETASTAVKHFDKKAYAKEKDLEREETAEEEEEAAAAYAYAKTEPARVDSVLRQYEQGLLKADHVRALMPRFSPEAQELLWEAISEKEFD
jgi:DNA-binding transcriptional MocR family regulator